MRRAALVLVVGLLAGFALGVARSGAELSALDEDLRRAAELARLNHHTECRCR